MKQTIHISLSASGVAKAIDELKAYEREVLAKFSKFEQKLAEAIASDAAEGFYSSLVMDSKDSGHTPDVRVSVDKNGTITTVVAYGEDAVWCEFGSGIYYNGSAGTSPNPFSKNTDIDVTIGSYGKGHGKQRAWGYRNESGELVITRGTPATMPMYKAAAKAAITATDIAKEVFG